MTRIAPPRSLCFALCASLLAACSQQSNQPSAADQAKAQAQTEAAEAQSELQNYRQMLQMKNDDLAVGLGQEIEQRFPHSPAADEVAKSLPDIQKRAHDAAEKRRLDALWAYQVGPMEGGTQSTASLYSTTPSGDRAVRLILRRHTKWGQSAYLFGSGHGFVCKGDCVLHAEFDGKPHPLHAYLPQTGEPAMFISDDKGFIAALAKTKRITIPVETRDNGQQTLVYEVAGFDDSKWLPAGKK